MLAVQALYQWDLRGQDFADQADAFLAESTGDSEVYFFAHTLVFGAWAFREQADQWIQRAAAHWEMRRMAAVDRNVLRLAIYEMLGRDDIPPRVAIDQAIELAKRFGSAESGAFVNGILDHVLRESSEAAGHEPPPPVEPQSVDQPAAPGEGHVVPTIAEGLPPSSGDLSDMPDIRNWDKE